MLSPDGGGGGGLGLGWDGKGRHSGGGGGGQRGGGRWENQKGGRSRISVVSTGRRSQHDDQLEHTHALSLKVQAEPWTGGFAWRSCSVIWLLWPAVMKQWNGKGGGGIATRSGDVERAQVSTWRAGGRVGWPGCWVHRRCTRRSVHKWVVCRTAMEGTCGGVGVAGAPQAAYRRGACSAVALS